MFKAPYVTELYATKVINIWAKVKSYNCMNQYNFFIKPVCQSQNYVDGQKYTIY